MALSVLVLKCGCAGAIVSGVAIDRCAGVDVRVVSAVGVGIQLMVVLVLLVLASAVLSLAVVLVLSVLMLLVLVLMLVLLASSPSTVGLLFHDLVLAMPPLMVVLMFVSRLGRVSFFLALLVSVFS